MSYILDALQKNATEEAPAQPAEGFPGLGTAAPNTNASGNGLALPWKLAIGTILLANVALVFLWRTDRVAAPASAASQQTTAAPAIAPGTANDAPAKTQFSPATERSNGKKTLPGIVSPRPLPLAGNAYSSSGTSSAVSAGAARTFKPSGRPITIAGEPEPGDLVEEELFAQSSPAVQPLQTQPTQPPATEQAAPGRVIPQQAAAPAPSARARSASALSTLGAGAREALYALTFSFHIYGNESDLRSVVVNGQRRIEGQSVTAANGNTFTIAEITDGGAIIEFDHEGESVSVAIPVMEDWKDS